MKNKYILAGLFLSLAGSTTAQTWPQTATLLKDVSPGSGKGISGLIAPIPLDGKLVFEGYTNTPNDWGRLHTSDGTTAGTNPVSGPVFKGNSGSYIQFASWKGMLFHTAVLGHGFEDGWVLYRTRTNGNGSDSLAFLQKSTISTVFPVYDTSGGSFYFIALTNANDVVIMKTDGTPAGTAVVPTTAGIINGTQVAALGSKIFYRMRPPNEALYVTDVVTGIHTKIMDGNARAAGRIGNLMYLISLTGTNIELWATDGTLAGTTLIKSNFSSFFFLKEWKGKAYFGASTSASSSDELWTSDGTPAGTQVVFSLPPAAKAVSGNSGVGYAPLIDMGDFMIFTGNDTAGLEPWRTDGTAAGTYRIKDLNPDQTTINGRGSIFLGDLKPENVIDGRLYFRKAIGLNKGQLHVTDGTEAGTVQATSVISLDGGSYTNVVKYNNRIYFAGNDAITGREIYSFPAPTPIVGIKTAANPPKALLLAYPNPAQDAVFVDAIFNGKKATLFSNAGTLVSTQIVTGHKVLLADLPAGIYTLVVEGGYSTPVSVVR